MRMRFARARFSGRDFGDRHSRHRGKTGPQTGCTLGFGGLDNGTIGWLW